METYDESKIGALISGKSQHSVYEYGADEVIKFDRFDFLVGPGMSRIEQRHVDVCKQYFGDLLLDTRFAISPRDNRVALIQPKISGQYLSARHFDTAATREDYLVLIERRNRLLSDGNPDIDFLGQGGLFHRCMSNVFVLPDGRLRIIDAFLIELTSIPFGRYVKPIVTLVLKRQQKTIDLFLACATH